MQFHVDSTTEVDVVPAQKAFVDHAGRLRNATVGGIFREGLGVIEESEPLPEVSDSGCSGPGAGLHRL